MNASRSGLRYAAPFLPTENSSPLPSEKPDKPDISARRFAGEPKWRRTAMQGKIEDSFRYMAFLVYYQNLRDECDDLMLRFATAVVQSARPIPADKVALIEKWWKERRSIHARTEDGE